MQEQLSIEQNTGQAEEELYTCSIRTSIDIQDQSKHF